MRRGEISLVSLFFFQPYRKREIDVVVNKSETTEDTYLLIINESVMTNGNVVYFSITCIGYKFLNSHIKETCRWVVFEEMQRQYHFASGRI